MRKLQDYLNVLDKNVELITNKANAVKPANSMRLMRTVPIPLSRLIKFIPSEPDGGMIPGKVLWCESPSIRRADSYSFELNYIAVSQKERHGSFCYLDEDLDVVPGSNRFRTVCSSDGRSRLIEDGIIYAFGTHGDINHKIEWDGHTLNVPNPFNALGRHKMTDFVQRGLVQIACCAPAWSIRLAVVKPDKHLISETVVELKEPVTFGPPCQHNVGWMIPWQTKSQGVNIAWLDDKEMDGFIDGAGSLPNS